MAVKGGSVLNFRKSLAVLRGCNTAYLSWRKFDRHSSVRRQVISLAFFNHPQLSRISNARTDVILQGCNDGKKEVCTHSRFSSTASFSTSSSDMLDLLTYERVADETLEDLADFFEILGDEGYFSSAFDVQLASGVLTIHIGENIGTYVINKQTPNKQLWLSSPKSGPKRYDYVKGSWVYSHDGIELHTLLSEEISEVLGKETNLRHLAHGGQDCEET